MTKTGVNTDPRNPVGDPPADKLRGFTYARFPYNVSVGIGSLDFEAAYQFYAPRIDALRGSGVTPIIVFTHQTWGEGQGEGRDFNWKQMGAHDWDRFVAGLVNAIRRVAARYIGRGIVWQVGNENDNDDVDNIASVYMPPKYYGALFRIAYDAIKTVDSSARVIIGGLVTGPGKGIPYYNATGITQHDGIGIHCYGAGAGGLYGQHGTIEYQLNEWRKLGRRLWITEFGVLNQPNEPIERVAAYARAFVKACGDTVACWYAWGEGMHNGYGIENRGIVRQPLFEALMTILPSQPTPTVKPFKVGTYTLRTSQTHINLRSATGEDIGDIRTGDTVEVLTEISDSLLIGGLAYQCQMVFAKNLRGYIALTGTFTLEPVTPPPADPRDETLARNREAFVAIRDRAAAEIAAIDAVLGA